MATERKTSSNESDDLRAAVSTSALFLADFFSSWIGYLCALCVAHPIDTARIRWQTRGVSPRETLARDGLRSLYAGIAAPAVANGPMVAATFALNELFRACARWTKMHLLGMTHLKNVDHFTVDELAVAGLLAGMSSSFLNCPAAVIRVQQQVGGAGGKPTPTVAHVARQLWLHEGLRGFYRALPYESLSSGIGRMTYFTTYELAKANLQALCPEVSQTGRMIAAASFTSFFGWASCFPLDVIKNKLQADLIAAPEAKQYRGFVHCCEVTYRAGGLRAFWTGFSLTVARSCISSGISLPIFDTMKPLLRGAVSHVTPPVAASLPPTAVAAADAGP